MRKAGSETRRGGKLRVLKGGQEQIGKSGFRAHMSSVPTSPWSDSSHMKI